MGMFTLQIAFVTLIIKGVLHTLNAVDASHDFRSRFSTDKHAFINVVATWTALASPYPQGHVLPFCTTADLSGV